MFSCLHLHLEAAARAQCHRFFRLVLFHKRAHFHQLNDMDISLIFNCDRILHLTSSILRQFATQTLEHAIFLIEWNATTCNKITFQ